jgi:uncharacterized membrane protein YhfC
MLFFIVSLIRIPLNDLLLKILTGNIGIINNNIIYQFIFLSFSTAIFEEGFRVVGIGAIIRRKSYYKGLMYGVGHGGGGGAMIFAGFSTLASYLAYKFFPDSLPALSIEQFINLQWYFPLIGAAERLLIIILQIALSVLVMYAFISKKYYFILIAIVYHLIIDFVVLYLNYFYGLYFSSAATLGFALISLIPILLLKPRYRPMHANSRR